MKHGMMILLAAAACAFCLGRAACADEKDLPAKKGDPHLPCPAECRMKMQHQIRAADWVNAWQAAKESCPEANAVMLHLTERSGPEVRGVKIFECVDLKASGELLVIRIKKGDRQDEAVMIIRAIDLIRIEISRRPPGQD